MKNILILSLVTILVFGLISPILPDLAFGQLESITITGPKRVLKDSVFTFVVDVKGVSRASYGDFGVVVEIVEKDSGVLIIDRTDWISPGKNSFLYSGKVYSTGDNKVILNPVEHIFRIHQLHNIWEYEFLVVDSVEELTYAEQEKPNSEEPLEPIIQNNDPKVNSVDSRIWVEAVYPTNITGKYIPDIEACAGTQRLVSPEIIISSDLEQLSIDIGYVISSNSCREYNHAKIRANDPQSITVEYAEKLSQIDSNLNEVQSLKEQIIDLKEQIDNKDAIIMEQIKVIQQLISNFKKTIFEPISHYFGIA